MIDERRRRLLARLHCERRRLRLDEENYRAKLSQLTGKRSAATCSDTEIKKMINMLANMFTSTEPEFDRWRQTRKCWAQAYALTGNAGAHTSCAYLQGLARRMTCGKDFFAATGQELHAMSAAMTYEQKRRELWR